MGAIAGQRLAGTLNFWLHMGGFQALRSLEVVAAILFAMHSFFLAIRLGR
jgi:hypothetical protein